MQFTLSYIAIIQAKQLKYCEKAYFTWVIRENFIYLLLLPDLSNKGKCNEIKYLKDIKLKIGLYKTIKVDINRCFCFIKPLYTSFELDNKFFCSKCLFIFLVAHYKHMQKAIAITANNNIKILPLIFEFAWEI